MHVKIRKEPFLKALAHQQNVVERKSAVPILSHILLEATFDKRIKMIGTDLEMTVVESVEADVLREGSVTLSGHLLYDIVRKFPEGAEVVLEAKNESQVVVQSGSSAFELPSLPLAEFPKMTQHDPNYRFSLKPDVLRRLIDQTRFAISTEEVRFYLNGVYMHTEDDHLKVVATDGHRLALSWVALPAEAKGLGGVILSRKTVAEVRKLMEGAAEEIKVSISSAQAAFEVGGVVLYARLVQGQFPDYRQAIPIDNPLVLTLNAREFEASVDRVSLVTQYEKVRSVKMHISGEKGLLSLTAQSSSGGLGHEEMSIAYKGEDLTISFNARYLLDVAQQIRGEKLEFLLKDPATPALIKDTSDACVLYILMPMRL